MSQNDIYTKDTEKRFTLRMDKDLFERISKHAKINRRSVAKEIENAVAMYVDYCDEAHKDYLYNFPEEQR